eukprot:4301424-Amphidinium_carterae.1
MLHWVVAESIVAFIVEFLVEFFVEFTVEFRSVAEQHPVASAEFFGEWRVAECYPVAFAVAFIVSCDLVLECILAKHDCKSQLLN